MKSDIKRSDQDIKIAQYILKKCKSNKKSQGENYKE